MKRNLFVISLTILFLFGATACSSVSTTQGATSQGKNATIVLDENPTTGYTWAITIDNQNILSLANDSYVPTKTNDKIVGSGGFHTYIFQAKSPGIAIITFDLGQQWSGGEKGAKTKKFQVTVGQDGNISSTKEI